VVVDPIVGARSSSRFAQCRVARTKAGFTQKMCEPDYFAAGTVCAGVAGAAAAAVAVAAGTVLPTAPGALASGGGAIEAVMLAFSAASMRLPFQTT
jgi:hypothetical protein